MSVAVIGASGFVGATLVERLLRDGVPDVRACIHSSGNAARLARHGTPLTLVNLLDRGAVRAALEGCDAVVNCSRGDLPVMFDGLRNLLAASETVGVKRFVHLSSVAVYGDLPEPVAAHESAPPRAPAGSYGAMKARQDAMVLAAARRGLSCAVLCPPNISGAYSPFVREVLTAIGNGEFALVDAGGNPCNLVDVENLVAAIRCALTAPGVDGTRIFVTDDAEVTWADLAQALQPLAGGAGAMASVPREEVLRLVAAREPRPSLMRAARHLGSSGVRRELRRDPLLAAVERGAKRAFGLAPSSWLDRLKREADGTSASDGRPTGPVFSLRLLQQQLRAVRHSCARARAELGYVPVVSFAASVEAFGAWYRRLCVWDGEPLAPWLDRLG